MEAFIKESADNSGAIGAGVGMIDQGKTQYFYYGKKSLQNDEPISEDTIFEIGSITKVFTTLILKDMVANGNVQLDEPIETYLSGIKIPKFAKKKITLRHLATHLSGLPSLPNNFNPKNPMNPYADYSIDDLYHFLINYNLPRAPGESFEYSNVGMGLLGHILSKKAGVDYKTLVSERICEKLGMKNTGITLPTEMEKHFAKGYHQMQEIPHWDIPTLAGAGALRSNIKDMTKFLAACMSGDIGLGWMISHSSHADVMWHNGGTGGFRAFLGFNPKTQKGIVVLSNSSEAWPDSFSLSILDPETYPKPAVNQTLAQDLDYLTRFEGAYKSANNEQKMGFVIKLRNLEIVASVPGGELNLLPESFGLFSLKGTAGQKLRFIMDDTGTITKAQMETFNGSIITEFLHESKR